MGFPPVLDKQGYKLTDPGRYQNLTDNFSAQITAFKNAQCQIVTGVVLPPDFTTFWKQALQQGFKPKAASVGKAILFPVAVEALGKDGHNLSSEVWWSPSHPFKSSLNGMTAKQLAGNFTLLSGDLFRRTDADVREGRYGLIVISREGNLIVRCEIDKNTLAAR